jgi:hypothetical protein|tara:strand:+ start:309 stop:632 length:324 start_codon:yes stop_codon:yes gene_type:complete
MKRFKTFTKDLQLDEAKKISFKFIPNNNMKKKIEKELGKNFDDSDAFNILDKEIFKSGLLTKGRNQAGSIGDDEVFVTVKKNQDVDKVKNLIKKHLDPKAHNSFEIF